MDRIKWTDKTNMSMLTDFYEFTMSKGYLDDGNADRIAYFDLFFRAVPENGGYAIVAGLEQMIDYLQSMRFGAEDIDYLRSLGFFDDRFLSFLQTFRLECDIWAIPEGTPVFPGEPLVKVRGPIAQAQLIETMLLTTINHQSLIATKASRIARAASGRTVFEFGARRAQGYDAAVLGARAAYIGGVTGTSCTIAGQQFDIPVFGTMAHSWVQLFDSEYESFAAYARSFPTETYLLVDTYNVLKSGIPNAIAVAREILEPAGNRLKGIRIDSGDLAYLTKAARQMLDDAGLTDCKITVSNALDEYIIRDLLIQGACIDSFGVGERLITSRAEPVFGGVYKLSGVEIDGQVIPKMKISENVGKVTNPCSKDVFRFYDRETGKALADVITVVGEEIDESLPYEIFDPVQTWKRKVLENFSIRRLLEPIFINGRCVYTRRDVREIREYCSRQLETLWDSVLRFENPQNYYVDLSEELWNVRNEILHNHRDNTI
ncbi:MAG: nicotinate phosphoribosyltransferase [Clostridiaceae bacterium]|jgi:nicotinate phosphoribosyltransferase|nr:nicotinate phosphoribosyltransferase [Clostridiaceae bacterium]